MAYQTCDTEKIRVLGSVREFDAIEDLLKSGVSGQKELELTGVAFRYWWKNLTVAFPDRQHSSSSMVEVHGANVLVGTPNRYSTIEMESIDLALRLGEKINNAWLNSKASEEEFISDFDFENWVCV